MPKNPLNQYLWLIEKLMKKPMSLAQLQESFSHDETANSDHRELQAKTLYNWRLKIKDIFNIDINYVGDKYQVTDEGQPERKAALDWLVQSLAVNTAVKDSRNLSKRIMLEDVPSGDLYLRSIIEAMKEGRRIRFIYARFNEGIGKEVEAEPYCLKVSNRRWYLVCRVPDGNPHHSSYPDYDCYGCIRIYALDRMLEFETLEEKFEYPEDFDPEDLFRDYVGVCIAYGEPLERVLLHVSEEQREYIETLPLHHSQQLVEETDYGAIFEYRLHPTIDFRRALMSMGMDVEVLAPDWLRDCMAEQYKCLNMMYNR